jgi:hypothetical protein
MSPFIIETIKGWCDVTDEIESENPPWTLARPNGVGAFQFSGGLYRGGKVPNPSADVLLLMLREFASHRTKDELNNVVTEEGRLRLAAGSFTSENNFIRAWYVSDGCNFAQVTYTCLLGEQHEELPDCEQMVRTLKFSDKAT